MTKLLNKLLNKEEKVLKLTTIALFLEKHGIEIIEMNDLMAWVIMPNNSRGLYVKTRDINTVVKIKKFLATEL